MFFQTTVYSLSSHQNVTFNDVIRDIHQDSYRLASFVMILIVPFIELIGLFLIGINNRKIEIMGCTLFLSIRFLNFIAIFINTYKNKISLGVVPEVISSFNNNLPFLAMVSFFFEISGSIMFINSSTKQTEQN